MDTRTQAVTDTLYQTDFFAWTQEQAKRLRATRPNVIDWENIAEELEDMGASQRSQIETRLYQLLFHLAKLAYASEPWPRRGWKLTVVEQRARIQLVIGSNPSLHAHPAVALERVWTLARQKASLALRHPIADLPEACPFDLEAEILNPTWFPVGGDETRG